MSCQDSSQRKKLSYKIGSQNRPFVDENLQFQLPSKEDVSSESSVSISNYSTRKISIESPSGEIDKLFNEASRSFNRWKLLKENILKTIQKN